MNDHYDLDKYTCGNYKEIESELAREDQSWDEGMQRAMEERGLQDRKRWHLGTGTQLFNPNIIYIFKQQQKKFINIVKVYTTHLGFVGKMRLKLYKAMTVLEVMSSQPNVFNVRLNRRDEQKT